MHIFSLKIDSANGIGAGAGGRGSGGGRNSAGGVSSIELEEVWGSDHYEGHMGVSAPFCDGVSLKIAYLKHMHKSY